MIPLKYNVRNLRVRWVTTALIVLGTGMVVWSSCILFGFVDGLQHSLRISGEPLDLIVLRKGADAESSSGYDAKQADAIAELAGIARDATGRPLVAAEMLNIPTMRRTDGSRANVIIRGVEPASRPLRPAFTIVRGHDFSPGKGECIVSRNLSRRFRGAGLGGDLRVSDREAYRVVGLFTAGGSAAESEVWVDLGDLRRNLGREGSVSCVQLRAADPGALATLRATLADDPQFKLLPLGEAEYYRKQSRSGTFLKAAGTLIAILLTIAAMFASANTMFAAVKSRTREIGTMRALGFPRRDILVSFLAESLMLCSLGGLLGLLATLPLRALTFNTSNFDTFTEVAINFRLGPWVMVGAFAMTLAMGLFGGLFPAFRAVKLDVVRALREL